LQRLVTQTEALLATTQQVIQQVGERPDRVQCRRRLGSGPSCQRM
jgi:hypothetical protein